MSDDTRPLVTVVVPSFNQARFLQECLDSIYRQQVPLEICVADGGSTDGSAEILKNNSDRLDWYQSKPDGGQSNGVNVAVAQGSAPYIYWINSDDIVLDGALAAMVDCLEARPDCPMVYGEAVFIDESSRVIRVYPTAPFSLQRLALRCLVSQPAVLIRREVWESLGGLQSSLHLAMDYDLWWRVAAEYGPDIPYLSGYGYLAATRVHRETKTNSHRRDCYLEAMEVARSHYPIAVVYWYLKYPWSVWYKTLRHRYLQKEQN